MKSIGRALQIIGLVLLPLAMILEISGALSRSSGLADMLKIFVGGTAAFLIGRIIEGYSASPE